MSPFKEGEKGQTHSYPIITKQYAVVTTDEYGQTIQLFHSKKKCDEFWKELSKIKILRG